MSQSLILKTLEKNVNRRSSLFFVLLMALGWGILLIGDWYFRFAWFEWSRELVVAPRRAAPIAAEDRETPLFRTNAVSAARGGDLSRLIGIADFVKEFEEVRPAFVRVTDRYGYINRPYEPDAVPDIVVLGDSFMATGTTDTMFSSLLGDRTGRFIYNQSLLGHGPFISIHRFINDERFLEQPPRLVIWGFAEREITGDAFAGMIYHLQRRIDREERAAASRAPERTGIRIRWNNLSPHRLKRSLPNTSVIAQAGEQIWNQLRYLLFRQITPDVVPSLPVWNETSLLFFRYHIETLRWSPSLRDVPRVGWAVERLNDYLHGRGIKLLVLLIPEKEQVYRDAIPSRFNPPHDPIPRSVLWDVEAELKRRGIPVVNILPLFRESEFHGELVYWRDDTHWNVRGREIAVDKTWREIRRHFPELAQEAENE